MRIIIAGAGEIGFYLSQMLAKESHDIVVIDKNRDILNWVDSHTDVITTCGDSTSIKTLQEAGADRADLLIAVTQLQETNLLIAAIGKQLGAKKTIARVDNSEYLRTDIDVNFEILGIDSLIYPKCLAAQEIDWVLKQATAKSAVEFEDGKLILIEMTIEKDAPIDNKTMVEIGQMNIGLDFRIVAVAHQGKTIIPHGYDKVHEGDRIFIVVNRESTDELINLTGNQKIIIKDIMILGGSRLGVKIAQQLQNYYSVKLIEDDRKKCVELANFLTNTLVLHGDGRDMDFLMEENIDKMDAFIAVTGDSETNMLTCLSVKEKGVKKTIALIENMSYTILSQNLGIDTIINKQLIAASYIFRFIRKGEIVLATNLSSVDAEIFEYYVKPGMKITKKPIKDLNFPTGAIIGGVVRGNESFITIGSTLIKPGDYAVVFSLPDAIHEVEVFFN